MEWGIIMNEAEKKASRKEANHKYYVRNHTKWGDFYPKSTASQTGTGDLGSHKLDDEKAEWKAINKEMIHLGLRKVCDEGGF